MFFYLGDTVRVKRSGRIGIIRAVWPGQSYRVDLPAWGSDRPQTLSAVPGRQLALVARLATDVETGGVAANDLMPLPGEAA
jgi:hypothetical protein